MKPFCTLFLILCLLQITAVQAMDETKPGGLTTDSLFQQLHDQLQADTGPDSSTTNPGFQGMIEEGNRQLRMGVNKRAGHAFSADSLGSLRQGTRNMTLRLDEGLSDDCLAPTVIRLSNQSVSGLMQVQQFIGGEWDLLAFYYAESCRVLDVELTRPGMSDSAIERQLEP